MCPDVRLSPPAVLPLAAELADFIGGAVSISLGSCGAARVPNLTRGLGCRVSADRRRLRVWLAASASTALLADVAANATLAMVCSLPVTHRTVQLKTRDARIVALDAGDRDCVARYRAAFIGGLEALGYPAAVMSMLVAAADEDLAAIDFTPHAAFVQTPGPAAGALLGAGGGEGHAP